ncbi:LON peptidase substrate-binding domain-containing protein [Shewanella sp. FJAT-52076]|uniref:LON peptidase substrate-binding domain-containing protein n=1 Tax=Shewanella sp. FJAT-52076 TaxID=2864202 RepID=UPI001C65A2AB|nr:LON peptidase substrate-binding domain-containing protein [Shewanella sp. FJAT-52076]QYJ73839.1 LON peptidase substrate-binding domain-containing protein [Shewanella sp. FJAT-52076]
MQLALFPLPICLLPGGFTKLRIFEPRYKRLVSESLSSGMGFGLCMLGENNEPMPIATRVEIIDFETLDDGLLGISIAGIERIEIVSWHSESDGLKRGEARILRPWEPCEVNNDHLLLSQRLEEVMHAFPEHQNLNQATDFNDLTWVCQRWLELLPIALVHKQQCYRQDSPDMALALLEQIIEKD